MEHCRLAGISCMVLVSDKEGNYVKVNQTNSAAKHCAGIHYIKKKKKKKKRIIMLSKLFV